MKIDVQLTQGAVFHLVTDPREAATICGLSKDSVSNWLCLEYYPSRSQDENLCVECKRWISMPGPKIAERDA